MVKKLRKNKPTKSDIVVSAVFMLGGAIHHTHLEDVAVKSAELAPKMFSWTKYPEQINLESVRLALKNELSLPKARIIGGIKEGYMLNPLGYIWCINNNLQEINTSILTQIQRETERAKQTSAYEKAVLKKPEPVSISEFEQMIRVDKYFTPNTRKERILLFANAAVIDSEMRKVLVNLVSQGFNELEV